MSTPRPAELLGTFSSASRSRRYITPLFLYAVTYFAYLVCAAGTVTLPGWWVKGLCVIASGLLIGALYIIGHDAGHGVYVPGRWANRWLARFAFFPMFAPLSAWFRMHVWLHHNYLRVRGRDMVWTPWALDEYRSAPRWRRVWYRFLRTPIGLVFYWPLGTWIPYLLFPPGTEMGIRRRQNWFDRIAVIGFACALFAGLLALTRWVAELPWAEPVGPLGVLVLGLVLPYLLCAYTIGLVDLVQHTHPLAVWYTRRSEWDYYTANVRSTVHMILPLKLNPLMHNILEHTAHHLDPRIPLYHLPGAQAALEAAYPEQVPVERFTPGYVLRLLRTCRLYDFERRQWLDYDGTPTSPAQRPEAVVSSAEAAQSRSD
jgi:omega-6 fatty acid desaturase (delta-12 desaturase)